MKQYDKARADLNEGLYEAILQLKTKKECQNFLEDLCTPAELEALADRWQVAKMLTKKIPYRTISEKTGVSVTTITRVARCLNYGESGYKKILKKLGLL